MMARISGDSLIVRGEQRPDNSWLFTIRYIAEFEQAELGLDFDDSVQIADGGGAPPVPFVACGSSVPRKKRVVVNGECLAAAEAELYATVRLRSRDGRGVQTRSAPLRRNSKGG